MKRTYKIVDATVNHSELGTIAKKNIIYYEDGNEVGKELYSMNGQIVSQVNQLYLAEDIDAPVKNQNEINLE